MNKYELQQYLLRVNAFQYEAELLCNQRPVEVIARSMDGENYFENTKYLAWHGQRRIGDVAEAIFKIAQCNSGTEICVCKDSQPLEYSELLSDL